MKKKSKEEKHWEKTAHIWRDYAKKLELKLNMAKCLIRDVSCGGVSPEAPMTWDARTKIMWTAADWLKNQPGIPEPTEGFWP